MTKVRRPVTIDGKQYDANAVVVRKGQHYVAHDLARKLKRKAKAAGRTVVS